MELNFPVAFLRWDSDSSLSSVSCHRYIVLRVPKIEDLWSWEPGFCIASRSSITEDVRLVLTSSINPLNLMLVWSLVLDCFASRFIFMTKDCEISRLSRLGVSWPQGSFFQIKYRTVSHALSWFILRVVVKVLYFLESVSVRASDLNCFFHMSQSHKAAQQTLKFIPKQMRRFQIPDEVYLFTIHSNKWDLPSSSEFIFEPLSS